MALSEFFSLSALGVPLGLLMIAVLCAPERTTVRLAVTKWCLMFGSISTAGAVLAVVLPLEVVSTKGILGMLFVGLPALPAGLMLHFYSRYKQVTEHAAPKDPA